MTFWAIIFYSAMMGMTAPEMASFPDKESCIEVYVSRTPAVQADFPDLMTNGGCQEMKIRQVPLPKIQVEDNK